MPVSTLRFWEIRQQTFTTGRSRRVGIIQAFGERDALDCFLTGRFSHSRQYDGHRLEHVGDGWRAIVTHTDGSKVWETQYRAERNYK